MALAPFYYKKEMSDTRLDAHRTLQHVIVRGIEKRRIGDDKIDRKDVVLRMGKIAVDTGTIVPGGINFKDRVEIRDSYDIK